MKYFSSVFFVSIVVLSFGFSKDIQLEAKEQISVTMNGQEYNLSTTPTHQDPNATREQIDLIFDDFETTAGDWAPSDGWEINTTEYHSETSSYHAADYLPTDENGEPTYKSWDLFSPLYTLPELGDGESMHFDFWLNLDMPGAECDGDSYLDDYYGVSILDIASLAWHTSDLNSLDGPSWFCGFEDIGNGNPGYLDAWVQYLDTPSFEVPAGGTVAADLYWALESPDGAVVSGTCTDGWDQANVQISVDGGVTFTILESVDAPYDFGCGYGMVYNGFDCNVSGDCPGWGGMSDGWNNVEFDISAYAGQDAIVRYAFYSDPGWSTLDAPDETGFQVDNIVVSGGTFTDTADDEEAMNISGAVWVDQFYDYWDDGSTYDPRPGSNGWEQYLPGLPFNGNVFMDISDFAGKDVVFRFQTRLGELTGQCGEGEGMFVDDFRVYKESGGSYPTPTGLTAESGDSEIHLSWNDMNGSGTDDFVFDNDPAQWGGIQMSETGSTAWAGERIDLVGGSTINTVSIHSGVNEPGVSTTLAVFGMLGSLFNNSPLYTQEVTLSEGWNEFDLDLEMSNGYIVAMQFTNVENPDMVDGVFAPLDDTATPSTNSMILFSGGAWDLWSVAGATVGDGEWGVRANISYEGAGVTYNLYRDGNPSSVASGLTSASHTDTGLDNNTEYYYQVTATYSDGEESDYSSVVYATPFAQTVHEEGYDDGVADDTINAGSGKSLAVHFSGCDAGEQIVRFKWYQADDAGAFYIKMWADDGGVPGDELFSRVVAGGLVSGWNEYDLVADGLVVSGDFFMGIKEFSSTRPIGLDTSSNSGNSQNNASGAWESVDGEVMFRLMLDEAECGTGPDCMAGDINYDGGVDVLDVVQVVGFIIDPTNVPTDEQACAADMNGDGSIDVLDVVSMVGLIIN